LRNVEKHLAAYSGRGTVVSHPDVGPVKTDRLGTTAYTIGAEAGIKVTACLSCDDKMNVTDELEKIGIKVIC
jgi:hypothetical protein